MLGDLLEGHRLALQFGGLDGIRDVTLLESAIARPYSGYHRPIERKAAALLQAIAQNHGFVDGNKRTAVYALDLLLTRSGYRLADAAVDALEDVVIAVVEHAMSFDELVAWLRANIERLA